MYTAPQMTHAAHPVTTEVPADKLAQAFRCSWRMVQPYQVEARRRGPPVAARLLGRAELFKERLDRDRLKDPENGVEYYLATMREFFAKDNQAIFLCNFFQMLRRT